MPVESEATSPVPQPSARPRFWWVLLLPFAWLWFHLIDNLRLEWATDPQYSYSLVVPVLILGLLFRRWQKYANVPLPASRIGYGGLLVALAAFLVLLYLPTRLIEEATPEWRPIGWLLAGETIGLTLYAIYLCQGMGGVVRFAFPICFFFTAVPWPTLFEHPLVQGLSRANAAIVVDVLGILGMPAIQHGNVIEVSTGVVGINDACSGIRSLQSSLMISLFLGEFYFLRWYRRVLLVVASFLLAMFFNVCRTSFLTYLAAKHGTEAIAQYHDEAGMTILLACTVSLWGLGYLTSLFEKKTLPAPGAPAAKIACANGTPYTRLALVLVAWIAVVEIGVEAWYVCREAKIKPGPHWTMVLPEDNSTYQSLPITEDEHQLLRFDNVKQGRWQGADGKAWQAFYFDWRAGRVAGYLAKRHTPDICLPAVGMTLQTGPTLTVVKVDDLELPVRSYVFSDSGGTLYVFQCHWEPGAAAAGYAGESARFNLIRGIWAGRGNKGQKVFEIIVSGYNDLPTAQAAVERELEKLIHLQES